MKAFVITLLLMGLAPAMRAQDTLYVNDDATGANNGSSWADAYTSLQSALAAAQSGDQIWVATGVYYPTSGTNRSATFMLKNGVVLYGGFTGTETSLDQRDWQSNLTILSGDIDQNDTNDDGNFIAETWSHIVGNNSYNVVRGSGVDSTAVLDGFIITAGRANSDGPGNLGEGGGIYLTSNAAPTLRNLTLSGSRVNRGGGLSATAGSRPTLTDVTFTGNRADLHGGGLYVVNGAATLTRVTFEGNRADHSNLSGGGLYADNSALTLIDVTFRNNTGGTGGGMYVVNGADTLVLDRVVFDSNTAGRTGGAYISNSTATITNSTFISNSATGGQGGGLYVYPTSHITLTDVTFAGNQANSDGGGIFLFKDNTLVGTDLTFHDNVSGRWGWGGGLGGVKSNVTLTRAVFENNTDSGLGGGGLYLGDSFYGASTATLEDVIFTGNTSTDGGGGGIEFTRGTLTIRRGLIAGNTAANAAGGGLYLSGDGTSATLENVTVSGNTANSGFGGGGIYHGGLSLTLRNVTIAGNSNQYGSGQGAGLYVASSNTSLSMVNTILADNGSEDFRRSSSSTPAMSVTYSLIENQGNAGLTHGVDGNLIGQDPLLAPLANNGGFSQTHALLAGSPALDAGEEASCLPEDQRGEARPRDADNDGRAVCDLGALELGYDEIEGNWPPRAVALILPEAGDTLHVEGRAGEQWLVVWESSFDPDGGELHYTWQLAQDSLFAEVGLSEEVGSDTAWALTYAALRPLLDTLARGEQVRVFHRVVVYDEAVAVAGPSQRLYVALVNHPPVPGAVLATTDGERVLVEGSPEDTLRVRWQAARDDDGDTLHYRWQLATDSLFGEVLLERQAGTDTVLGLSFRELAEVLDGLALTEGTFYHRVGVQDGVAETYTGRYRLLLERGQLTAQEEAALPERLVVGRVYPNPSRGRSQLQLDVPWNATVCWSVHDVLGRRLGHGCRPVTAGFRRAVVLEVEGLASGVYLYRLEVQPMGAEPQVHTGRLVVVQ